MKYTAVFMEHSTGAFSTEFFVTHHDKNEAWKYIVSQTPDHLTLALIMPGEQHVYSQGDICFGSSAG